MVRPRMIATVGEGGGQGNGAAAGESSSPAVPCGGRSSQRGKRPLWVLRGCDSAGTTLPRMQLGALGLFYACKTIRAKLVLEKRLEWLQEPVLPFKVVVGRGYRKAEEELCLNWKQGRKMSTNGKQSLANTERDQFEAFFPQIVKDLTEDGLQQEEVADAITRLKKVIEYNVVGGKYNRGLTVVSAFRELVGPVQQDEKNLQRALVVGWCIELLQAFFLVADDIMDHSVTRRGQPCWYKKAGIGLDAVNDSFLLEACIYRLLKQHCRDQPFYLNLLELFLETTYQTEIGQTLDLITAPAERLNLNCFTEERYKTIVKHKTSFYSFYLPVAAAMYMAGIESKEEHAHAKAILLEMGEFFQIQDDYLDCFGDPAVTGKIGTDIEDNKCSWLVVQCLQRASAEQRRLLEEHYGQNDPDKVARVKQLYETLDLKGIYQAYEENSYQRLLQLISQHAVRLPSQIFLGLAERLYKRQK